MITITRKTQIRGAKAGSGRPARKVAARRSEASTVGESVITGLEQAIAWTRGKGGRARVTLVNAPEVDVRELRSRMGLSQIQFAARFCIPPATLRNWEQGRSSPDAPTRVLLAVIAKHPGAVEDACRRPAETVSDR